MRFWVQKRVAKSWIEWGLKEGEIYQHSMMTKSIERAQKK